MTTRWRVVAAVAVLGISLACGDAAVEEEGAPDGVVSAESALSGPWLEEATDDWGLAGVTHDAGAEGDLHAPEIMGSGLGLFDADGDGDLDLYLVNAAPVVGSDVPADGRGTPNRLFLRQGSGFVEASGSGLEHPGVGMGVAVGDVDNDGDEDVYLTSYGPDRLFLNRGDGTFDDATEAAGVSIDGWSSSAAFCDVDADGWLDLYVANDADPNQLWINRGDGTFRDEGLLRGASVNAQGLNEAGMGVVAGDFDDDSDFDLFVTHLEEESNTFYRNLGGTAGFEDTTASAGLAASSMRFTGFGTVAFDADLDGDLDLAAVNGRVKRSVDQYPTSMPEPWDRYAEPNLVYRNDGGTFRLLEAEATALTDAAEVSRGLAVGDLDGDGDPDVALTNTQGPARLFRNVAGDRAREAGGHWLTVDVRDPSLGRRLLGATLTVEAGDRTWTRALTAAKSYLSSSDPRPVFGLGPVETYDAIVVRYPGGGVERFPGGAADRVVVLERGEGDAVE